MPEASDRHLFARARDDTGPRRSEADVGADPRGFYQALHVTRMASLAEIQYAYRKEAAALANSHQQNSHVLKRLNSAYAVLGDPTRRAEYDQRNTVRKAVTGLDPHHSLGTGGKFPHEHGSEAPAPRRRHGRRLNPFSTNHSNLAAVVLVFALAAIVSLFLSPRIPIDLSILQVGAKAIGVGPTSRTPTAIALGATPASSPAGPIASSGFLPLIESSLPTGSPAATLSAEQFAGSRATPTIATPPQFGAESIVIKLLRNGQAAANEEVWLKVRYRTSEERWPQSSTARTDSSGSCTISFDVGDATPGYEVKVQVYTLAAGRDVPVAATTFTPR